MRTVTLQTVHSGVGFGIPRGSLKEDEGDGEPMQQTQSLPLPVSRGGFPRRPSLGISSAYSRGVSRLVSSWPPNDDSRRLPLALEWTATLIIGVSMALVSGLMIWADSAIVVPKFRLMERLIEEGRLPMAVLALSSFAFVVVAVVASLVVFAAPFAAGSGLPEVKGYLNGNAILDPKTRHNLFGGCRNWVRPVGSALGTAAGLATGREGPLVSTGASFGVAVITHLAGSHFSHWINLDVAGHKQEALIEDGHRFADVQRIHCVMGSAAGLAAAFYAPIGSVLYMFEEVTVTSWSPEMTFRTFVVTCVAALGSRALYNLIGNDVHQLVMFQPDLNYYIDREWFWLDLPFVVVLGAMGGALAAVYAGGTLKVWKMRQPRRTASPRVVMLRRVLEAATFAALSAAIMVLAPLLISQCTPLPPDSPDKPSADDLRVFRRYLCEEGHHNRLATLLLQGEEGAIKHLFERPTGGTGFSELLPLSVCLIIYLVLAIGVGGLSVPTGNFVPSMFLGAVLGRLLRQLMEGLHYFSFWGQLAHPGVYAILGSGAVLAGCTHMTVAVVVILAEATGDIKVVAPMMLCVLTARLTSMALMPMDLSEELIALKGVPYLEAECPRRLDRQDVCIGGRCEWVPDAGLLPREATLAMLREALHECPDLGHFPVVTEIRGSVRCVGLVPRSRLQSVVRAASPFENEPSSYASDNSEDFEETQLGFDQLGLSPRNEGVVLVHRLADAASFSFQEDVPISRVYNLFSRAGVQALVVTAREVTDARWHTNCGGDVVAVTGGLGVLERRHLTLHAPHHHQVRRAPVRRLSPIPSALSAAASTAGGAGPAPRVWDIRRGRQLTASSASLCLIQEQTR